ncbi:MAG: TIGR04086 family membrane protein [Clostridiales bacterium]|nr:TIGR04086 family membrane protein [Clostridiales bacterium]
MPKSKRSHRNKKKSGALWPIVKAALLASAAVLILIVIFTGVLYLEWLPESSIPLLNGIFKVVGAALAGLLVGRSLTERLWLFGGLAAALFQALATGCMGIFLGGLQLRPSLVGDILLAAVIGGAVAYAFFSLSKKKT